MNLTFIFRTTFNLYAEFKQDCGLHFLGRALRLGHGEVPSAVRGHVEVPSAVARSSNEHKK